MDTSAFTDRPTLLGERVLLRPVTVADAPGLVELLGDPESRRLTGTHGHDGPDIEADAQRWYASVADRTDRLDLAIRARSDGEFVGEAVLNELDEANRSCSFRICLVGPRVFGRGYGTEATRLLLGHAFETVGLNRVGLEVFAFNPRARRVYEKVGFVHEGTRRQALRWDGEWVDAHDMSVLAEEWAVHGGRVG